MAGPGEKQYVEKPRKVVAAPYDPDADPPQRGVSVYTLDPSQPPRAYAHVWNDRAYALAPGLMIVFDSVFVDRLIAVMTVAEFEAIYGNVPGETALPLSP
jgi:hypothetical protein